MQDPTPLIKDLVDQLEHAHDILGMVELSDDPDDEAIDRAEVLARANAYLTACRNADIFEQEPSA